jgi:hypothetical protein
MSTEIEGVLILVVVYVPLPLTIGSDTGSRRTKINENEPVASRMKYRYVNRSSWRKYYSSSSEHIDRNKHVQPYSAPITIGSFNKDCPPRHQQNHHFHNAAPAAHLRAGRS